MKVSRQMVDEREANLLRSLLGQSWVNMSGPGMLSKNFSWDPIRVETSGGAVEIGIDMTPITITSHIDDYPILRISTAKEMSKKAISEGLVYFHGQGHLIQEVWILREVLVGLVDEKEEFKNIADIAVAFNLGQCWNVVLRGSHLTDDLRIQYVDSRDQIQLPATLNEWETNLLNQYELSREWIRVA